MELILLAAAGFIASVLNALAGGGALVTLPALILSGLDARTANMTSIVALFPGQIAIAWTGREAASGVGGVPLAALVGAGLAGGLCGALLLIATPGAVFAGIVPWLIAFATLVLLLEPRLSGFIEIDRPSRWTILAGTALISVYGGYFGGGVGFIIIAALTLAGATTRAAGATKNVMAAGFNATAILAYGLSGEVDSGKAAAVALGALAGGFSGGWMQRSLPEILLRRIILALGLGLTAWLLLRSRS